MTTGRTPPCPVHHPAAAATRGLIAAALIAAALAVSGCGHKPPVESGESAPATQPPADRPFDYRTSTLSNGMQVITLEDHSTPIVEVEVWYHVGSKDEKPDRRGFAHMFEHMMFRGTSNIGPKAHFQYIHRVGGNNNAGTSFDTTNYIQEVPSSQLEMVLWLEAERMGFLKINQGYFDTERKVVAEEYRMGHEQPYGDLIDTLLPALFKVHPYRWSPIGDMDELAQATADELQTFWNTYYVPNNATLVVVGDIQHDQVKALAEKYFGWFPRYPDPPRVTVREPVQTEPRKITLKVNNGPAPIVGLAYHTVPAGHADELPLSMLGQVLGQGDSSRLSRDLVHERELAMFAMAGAFTLEQDGLFVAGAVLPVMGGKPDQVLAALREHIARIQKDGVTEIELDKARNGALRDAVAAQRYIAAKASALGEAAVVEGDVERVNTKFDEIRAVTAADLQRVAKTYLVNAHENEIRIEPNMLGFLAKQLTGGDDAEKDDQPAAPDSEEISGGGSGKPGLVRPADMAKTPPVAPLQIPTVTAKPSEQVLDNGMRVLVIPNHEVPFVSFGLGLTYGAFADPDGTPGVASMAASMLTRGTATKSYQALAEELDRYAIQISGNADLDSTMVWGSAVTEQADRALGLMSEVVREPSFPADELKKRVKQAKTAMAVQEKSPEFAADKELRRRLFPGHPYRRLATGESSDLDKITAPALATWWKAHCRPDRAFLFIAGDLDPEAGFALARKQFGAWRAEGTAPAVDVPAPPATGPTHIYLVDRKGDQSQIRVGQLGVTRKNPAWFRARFLSEVFGGGFNARLMDRIRVKEGLTYGAYGGFRANRFAGRFVASTFTKNATVGQAVTAIIDEIERLQTDPPTASERADTRSYLLGSFVGQREGPDTLARDQWRIATEGLAPTFFQDYLDAVAEMTSDQVAATARQLLDPDRLVIVVVGPADQLRPQLEKIAPVDVIE